MKSTKISQKALYFLLGLGSIIILWYVCALLLDKAFLPTPTKVIANFPNLFKTYDIEKHFSISTFRIVSSLVLATLIGAPIGYICGRYESINKWISPYINFFYPLPKIVFLPIIIVLFGLGNFSKILLITLIICFQIIVIIRDEMLKIPKEWIRTMQTMTKNQWLWLRHLFIPYLLPSLITSLRISLGTAIAVLFVSETFVSINGLGFLILDTMESRNYPEMYGAILLLSLLGFILYGLLAWWEEKVTYTK